jgi:hypothetical protein
MRKIPLDHLTDRQRDAWTMRYRYGWTMTKIALKMGITPSGASKLVGRAYAGTGLPKCRISVIRRKPRAMTPYQLFRKVNPR